jgi:phosphoserine aminotransferase
VSAPIVIPPDLLPTDGRFCCGPSKVRHEQVDAIVAARDTILGTSHRKPPVKDLVGAVRAKLTALFGLPDGWEIVLGNGGTTVFWDAATFGLVESKSQHLVFGEFSSKFAKACAAAPHLGEPSVIETEPGTHPVAVSEHGIDVYAFTHNETSTGVAMPLVSVSPPTAASGSPPALPLQSSASSRSVRPTGGGRLHST